MPRKGNLEKKNLPNLMDIQQNFPGLGNMNEIVSMAQKIAQNVTKDNNNMPLDPQNLDMSKILSQVSGEVSKMVTPDFLNKLDPSNSNVENENIPVNSKINLERPNKKIEEIEESDDDNNEISPLAPRTKDLNFTLNVTLEELYTGKVKKLAVRRKKIVEENGTKKVVEEKKKLSVVIEPGMYDEQIITYNKQADEKEGYEAGDIIITLSCSEHQKFSREGDNLVLEQEISLYEIFKPKFSIDFIDGKTINIMSSPINIFGDELDSFRKLPKYGMPILNNPNEFGNLLIQFKPILPANITDENLNLLKLIFPPVNSIDQNINEYKEMELVTESDFEFSDNDSSESLDSDEESDESASDSENSE